jgi:phosphoketolase
VRIVAVANPRRLYRSQDVAWKTCSQPDGAFMDDAAFNALFDGDLLCAVSGGPGAPLEPVLLRTRAPRRELLAWQRGETSHGHRQRDRVAVNGLSAGNMVWRIQRFRQGDGLKRYPWARGPGGNGTG